MSKLLSANLSRLVKSKLFWLLLLAMLIISVIFMFNNVREVINIQENNYQNVYYIDSYYFNLAPIIGIFFAVFISLFIGTEYNDGTIRNKLIIGHTRTNIYFANLLTCTIASFAFVSVWLIGGLVGLPFFTMWQMSGSWVLLYIIISLFFSAALSAFFTFIGMVYSSKAGTAVVSLLLIFGMLIFSSIIYNALMEPEMISGAFLTSEGVQMGEPELNPQYINGIQRTVYELFMIILPTGQGILMANLEIKLPIFQIVSSFIITLLVTVLGVILFRKKDLK